MNNSSAVPDATEDRGIAPRVMNVTLMMVGFATVLMNVFVISLIACYKWMRSPSNLIICSMAVTDLLAGMVTITAGAVKWTDWFTIRGLFCEVFFAVDIWAAMASLAHVFVVNAERYLAIVCPLRYKNITSVTRIRLVLVSIWIVTLLEAVGYTMSYESSNQCVFIEAPFPGLAFGLLVISIGLPFLSVIVIYVHIVIVLVRKMRFMAKSSSLDQRALTRSQRKMFGTVSAILAAWIICWLPLMLVITAITFAQVFDIDLDLGNFVTVFYYVEVMSYGNSLLNPILYFLTSAKFRKAGLLLSRCQQEEKGVISVYVSQVTEDTRL